MFCILSFKEDYSLFKEKIQVNYKKNKLNKPSLEYFYLDSIAIFLTRCNRKNNYMTLFVTPRFPSREQVLYLIVQFSSVSYFLYFEIDCKLGRIKIRLP